VRAAARVTAVERVAVAAMVVISHFVVSSSEYNHKFAAEGVNNPRRATIHSMSRK
jgi:hypothetical protein